MNRPTRHEIYMIMAEDMSERSTCLRRKTGAVLVKDDQIVATGYNGAPKGVPHCDEVGCIRIENDVPSGERHELCRGVHAEQNAIIQSAYHGVEVKGGTLYTTTYPCSMCARVIINAGLSKIIYKEGYPDELGKKLLKQSDVEVEKYDDVQKSEKSSVVIVPNDIDVLTNYDEGDDVLIKIINKGKDKRNYSIDIEDIDEVDMKVKNMTNDDLNNIFIDENSQELIFINFKVNDKCWDCENIIQKQMNIKVKNGNEILYDDDINLRIITT